MILVIGGLAAGKYEYVTTTLGYPDSDIARGVLDEKPVLADLHDLIRAGHAVDDELLEELRRKEVITCSEVGAGVVPLEVSERQYRDEVGKLCAELVKSASKVIRIYYGLPTVIKDQG